MIIRIKRLAAIFLLASVMVSAVSCAKEENSASEESSSLVSETSQPQEDIKSKDDEAAVSEVEDSDLSEDTSTNSEDVSDEDSFVEITSSESSEDNSADVSQESLEDISVDVSQESLEDVSDNISDTSTEEPSADNSEDGSDASSSVVYDFMAEFLEKYKDLESVKAITSLGDKFSKKMKISLNAQIEGMNNTYVTVEGYINYNESDMKFVFDCDIVLVGSKMMDIKILYVGEEMYLIDDYSKEYCIVSGAGDELPLAGNLLSDDIAVKTENQLIEGIIYKTDWFIAPDQNQVGIFTKDGKIEFLSILAKINQMQTPLLFDVAIGEYDLSVDFSIPEGYSQVSQENFKIGILG